MSLSSNQFIDLTEENTFGFTLTTEEPAILRCLAEQAHSTNTCAITGGGEGIYLSFLPQGGLVVGVDAAYNSIASTYLKGKLIETYSSTDLKSIIRCGPSMVRRVMQQFAATLPIKLLKPAELTMKFFDPGNVLWERYSRVWLETPDKVIDSARNNLDRLVLVHGNMADCREWGPYNLTYPSNAVDYSGFSHPPLSLYDLLIITADSGYVLSSHKLPADRTGSLALERTEVGQDSDHSYYLYRKTSRIWSDPLAKAAALARRKLPQFLFDL